LDIRKEIQMERLKNKKFWEKIVARAIRTMLQVVLTFWTATTLVTNVNWKMVLVSAVSAGGYSILTSLLAGIPEGKEEIDRGLNSDFLEAGKVMLSETDQQYAGDGVPNKADTNEPKVYEKESIDG
jgi:hypothetical protein